MEIPIWAAPCSSLSAGRELGRGPEIARQRVTMAKFLEILLIDLVQEMGS